MSETITGVAVKFTLGSFMFVCAAKEPCRHNDILSYTRCTDRDDEIQGFWTSRDRFVTRAEALPIAKAAGQFKRRNQPGDYDGPELFSEDLW